MMKLVILIALATLGVSRQGRPVKDSTNFILRLSNGYYDIKNQQEKLVRNVKGCAQFCTGQSDCVAFSCGLTRSGHGQQGPSRICSLIFVKDLNHLASVGITSSDGVNYYEMNCLQFCDRHNAELKLLACGPIPLAMSLIKLPKCECERIKSNCGISLK